MRKLYNFNFDCGRMGHLEGLFVADEGQVEAVVGDYLYFGEVLGKHSEVEGTLDYGDLEVVSEDQDFIEKLVNLLGDTISGYNPLHYVEIDEVEE